MITYCEVLDVLLVNDVIQSEPWGHAEKTKKNKKQKTKLVAIKTFLSYLF